MDKNIANKKPDLSVVMSVFNNDKYVKKAIDSILAQTFDNFEFIIIDDGSSDTSLEIIKSYSDKRIKIIAHSKNLGLVKSLNDGIDKAQTNLILRQDADDISMPDRIRILYELFSIRDSLVVAGSCILNIDSSGKTTHTHELLLNNNELRQELLVRSPFAHGSTMFKRDAFIRAGGYAADEWPAEDYGLWLRMSQLGSFANIETALYAYREHSQSTSSLNVKTQTQAKQNIRNKAWKLRKELVPLTLDLSTYRGLKMGNFRIKRVLHNLLYNLRLSVIRLSLITSIKLCVLIVFNKEFVRLGIRRAIKGVRFKNA